MTPDQLHTPPKLIDLSKMRRHYADFRAAWDRKEGQPTQPTLMTIAAVLAAEDLGALLEYLDGAEVVEVEHG